MSDRRRIILKGMGATLLVQDLIAPASWTKPVINAVVLPAHAQTSADDMQGAMCSVLTQEPVDEAITINVLDNEVVGPIAASRVGNNFSSELGSSLGQCGDSGASIEQTVRFSGTILPATNEISGVFEILQTCEGETVCEQLASFTATQTPLDANSDLGVYEGRLVGTLECCEDFF